MVIIFQLSSPLNFYLSAVCVQAVSRFSSTALLTFLHVEELRFLGFLPWNFDLCAWEMAAIITHRCDLFYNITTHQNYLNFYLFPVAVVDKVTAHAISLIPLSWRYLFLPSSNEICGEHFYDLQSCFSSWSCLLDSSAVCWSSRSTPAWYQPTCLQFPRRDCFEVIFLVSQHFIRDWFCICFNHMIFVVLIMFWIYFYR